MIACETFSKYHIKSWGLNPKEELQVEYVDAKRFLTAERMDLACKLYYIDCYEKKIGLEYAKELYTEHIRAFSCGTFIEPGLEEKNSIKKYFDSFNTLIEDVKINGLNPKYPVPVGKGGVILNGAHRTAIAIYYNLQLPVVYLEKINKPVFDYDFFQSRGLKRKYLDFMASQFIRVVPNSYVACVWPSVSQSESISTVEEILQSKAQIVYRKTVHLNYQGMRHLMVQLYGNQEWTGNINNAFCGIDAKVRSCYKKFAPTIVYLLAGNLNEIIEAKNKIREIFKIENHSIHITDTQHEAVEAAQVLFNDNSIHFLNYGDAFKYRNSLKEIIEFKEMILKNEDMLNHLALDSGAVLALYGLRPSSDIDYLSYFDFDIQSAENHCHLTGYRKYSLGYYVYNPEAYFYYMNLKFLTLDSVLFIKKTRYDKMLKKDKRDTRLIVGLKKRSILLEQKEKYTLKRRIKNFCFRFLGYDRYVKIAHMLKRK